MHESANRDPSQRNIGDFNLYNLSFRYDFEGGHDLTQDLSVSLNVNNVFDDTPPKNPTAGSTTNGNREKVLLRAALKIKPRLDRQITTDAR